MMSIEEAIAHCWDVFNGKTEQGKCNDCADEHGQLALWLEELLAYRKCGMPPNEPLTLEELQGMDGEPVWVVPIRGEYPPEWMLVNDQEGELYNNCGDYLNFYDVGRNVLAYRRKPEEGAP